MTDDVQNAGELSDYNMHDVASALTDKLRDSQAEVKRLIGERNAAILLISAKNDKIDELRTEVEQSRAWAEKTVADVVNARVVTCVYCGLAFPSGTPTSQDERLTTHIRGCEKHPMYALWQQACAMWDLLGFIGEEKTQTKSRLMDLASHYVHSHKRP